MHGSSLREELEGIRNHDPRRPSSAVGGLHVRCPYVVGNSRALDSLCSKADSKTPHRPSAWHTVNFGPYDDLTVMEMILYWTGDQSRMYGAQGLMTRMCKDEGCCLPPDMESA